MSHLKQIFLILLFAAGIGGAAYWQIKHKAAEQQALEPAPPPKPAVQFPVEETPAEPAPAPAVAEPASPPPELPAKEKVRVASPAAPAPTTLDGSLTELFGASTLTSLFRMDELVRSVVITVTEESSHQLPGQHLPWRPVPGTLIVAKDNELTALSPENAKRYEPYLKALEKVSAKRLAAVYARFYPAFQQSYKDAGNKGYFNDKVVAALDDMLAAPEPALPITLVQPEVFYKYSDEELEGLTSGQKLMVRIGAGNEQRLKVKLRELRGLVTHLGKGAK
jgi:hypothetical protein